MAYFDRVFKKVCMNVLHEGTVGYDRKSNSKYLKDNENVTWRNLFSVYNVYDLSKEFPCTTLFYDNFNDIVISMLDMFKYPIWNQSNLSKTYPLVRLNQSLNTYTENDVNEDNIKKVFNIEKILEYEDMPVNGVYNCNNTNSDYTINRVYIKKNNSIIKRIYSYIDNKFYYQMTYLDKILYDLKTTPLNIKNIGISDNIWDMDNTCRNQGIYLAFTVERDKTDAYPVLNMSLVHRNLNILRHSNSTMIFYALLLTMLAKSCNYKVGKISHLISNAYILERDVPIVNELIKRKEYKAPVLNVTGKPNKDLTDFTEKDFKLEDYKHGDTIAEMLDTVYCL